MVLCYKTEDRLSLVLQELETYFTSNFCNRLTCEELPHLLNRFRKTGNTKRILYYITLVILAIGLGIYYYAMLGNVNLGRYTANSLPPSWDRTTRLSGQCVVGKRAGPSAISAELVEQSP